VKWQGISNKEWNALSAWDAVVIHKSGESLIAKAKTAKWDVNDASSINDIVISEEIDVGAKHSNVPAEYEIEKHAFVDGDIN